MTLFFHFPSLLLTTRNKDHTLSSKHLLLWKSIHTFLIDHFLSSNLQMLSNTFLSMISLLFIRNSRSLLHSKNTIQSQLYFLMMQSFCKSLFWLTSSVLFEVGSQQMDKSTHIVVLKLLHSILLLTVSVHLKFANFHACKHCWKQKLGFIFYLSSFVFIR